MNKRIKKKIYKRSGYKSWRGYANFINDLVDETLVITPHPNGLYSMDDLIKTVNTIIERRCPL